MDSKVTLVMSGFYVHLCILIYVKVIVPVNKFNVIQHVY